MPYQVKHIVAFSMLAVIWKAADLPWHNLTVPQQLIVFMVLVLGASGVLAISAAWLRLEKTL